MSNEEIKAIQESVTYNPETGSMTWKCNRWRQNRIGKQAGSNTPGGYVRVSIDDRCYMAHRIAWLLMTGIWPSHKIDHINGSGTDNRWRNLRACTTGENAHNTKRPKTNSTGFKGVTYNRRQQKFVAQVRNHGRNHHIGVFNTAEEAFSAACAARVAMHGEFARHS